MPRHAAAVVIGAGALGASVAYHLAQRGQREVVLIDKHEVASQTSPRAAGLSAQVRGSDLMTDLAARSVAAIKRFSAETGEPLDLHQPGSLKIARTPEHAALLREQVERGQRLGVEIDFISETEAKRLCPFLEPVGITGITYVPGDIYLEPGQIPRGYARAAERLGVTVLPNTRVLGLLTRDGAIERVITDREEIVTPVVVDTAGAWAGLLGAMLGARIPAVATRHQLLITQPIDDVRPEQPIVRVIDVNVYIRPCWGGLMLGGYEPDPMQVDMTTLPPDFQIEDMPLDLGVLRRLADGVLPQFPVFRDLNVREHRGGLPTMTADGQHLVGAVPGVRGAFVAAGCCVGGLTIAPAIGEVLADWIMTGQPPLDLSPLDPGRFGDLPEERLKADCYWRYARHYSAP